MKRTLLGLFVSVAMTGTLIAAQDGRVPSPGQSQPMAPQDRNIAEASKDTETTVTGCLVQGSSPNIYLLQGAKVGIALATPAPADKNAGGAAPSASSVVATDRGATFRLEAENGAKAVDFKTHVNHQVTITGVADAKVTTARVAPGEKPDEKSWPKLSAKSITMLADTCSAIS